MEAGAHSTTDIDMIANKKLTRALLHACGVTLGSGIMEKICLATEDQMHRMEQHIETGAYMMQIVLDYEGVMDEEFLLRVLNEIRSKNQILRTRLVKHEGQVYQVILKDTIEFKFTKKTLEGFLSTNARKPMNYGSPLLRYAFVQADPRQSFFVWSVHRCAIDNWTLRLLFDDLQTACWDVAGYCELPPRPPYHRYTGSLEVDGLETGRAFWLSHHTAFDSLKIEFPVLGPGGTVSRSTMSCKNMVYIPKVENTQFDLLTLGHAAWALTIACLQNKGNLPPENKAVSFITMTSARRSNIEGIKDMMGPISARVPLRILLPPNASLEELMRSIKNEFTSMIGLEHCAMKILHPNGGMHNLPPQAVFSWNPLGSDILSARIACTDRSVAPGVLAYREDLSVAYAHDYGLLFEVYERDGYLAVYTSWDRDLVSEELIGILVGRFERFLRLMVGSEEGLSLQEVIVEDRKGEMKRVQEMNSAEPIDRAGEMDRARKRPLIARAEEMD